MKISGLFYRKKPLFGLDIGHSTVKVVQVDAAKKSTKLLGYGIASFEANSIRQGEIINFSDLGGALHDLMANKIVGHVSTSHISASLPVLQSFTRIINLPHMEDKDVYQAIELEAEQYIPMPLSELYLDYQQVEKTAEGADYLVSAAPRRVVDSYVKLFNQLELELVCLEPSIMSVARCVSYSENLNSPTLVIDCGSITTDLIIYSKKAVRITGTIKFGGNSLTENLVSKLHISSHEAENLKSSHGLDPSHHQTEIVTALSESLHFLTTEIKKIIRYFEDSAREQNTKIEQIIILGGGANLPGFSTYLTSQLRIPVRLASIWQNINTGHLEVPSTTEAATYATATGLALIKPGEAVA